MMLVVQQKCIQPVKSPVAAIRFTYDGQVNRK